VETLGRARARRRQPLARGHFCRPKCLCTSRRHIGESSLNPAAWSEWVSRDPHSLDARSNFPPGLAALAACRLSWFLPCGRRLLDVSVTHGPAPGSDHLHERAYGRPVAVAPTGP
jgi:hypothetical protein